MSDLSLTESKVPDWDSHIQIPRNLLFAILLVILGYNIFAYGITSGIGKGLYHAGLTLAVFITLPRQKKNIVTYILFFVSVLSGVFMGLRANEFVLWFDQAIANISLFGLFLVSASHEIPTKIWTLGVTSLRYFGWSMVQGLVLVSNMGKFTGEGSRAAGGAGRMMRTLLSLSKTFFITVVMLFVFAGILSQADPIFSKMIERVLSEAFGRIVISTFLASVVSTLLTIALSPTNDKDPDIKIISVTDIVVSVGGLLLLFAVFLGVQFRYLFASHEVFQTFGITYSQYVRKGFFELLVATSLGAVVSYGVLLKRRVSGQNGIVLAFITAGLLLELLLLLASAYRRDLMYIEVYGLTRARIVGEAFLYWLAGGIILLFFLNAWRHMRESFVVIGIGVCSLAAFLYFNVVNMDMKIVSTSPRRNESRDYFYIANLSEDAYEGWRGIITEAENRLGTLLAKSELSDTEKTELANIKLMAITLQKKRENVDKAYGPLSAVEEKVKRAREGYSMHDRYGNIITGAYDTKPYVHERKWQAKNASEYTAWQRMQSDSLFTTGLDLIISRISVYQHEHGLDISDKENWILYEFSYPFVDIVDYRPQYGQYSKPTPTGIPPTP